VSPACLRCRADEIRLWRPGEDRMRIIRRSAPSAPGARLVPRNTGIHPGGRRSPAARTVDVRSWPHIMNDPQVVIRLERTQQLHLHPGSHTSGSTERTDVRHDVAGSESSGPRSSWGRRRSSAGQVRWSLPSLLIRHLPVTRHRRQPTRTNAASPPTLALKEGRNESLCAFASRFLVTHVMLE